MQPPRALRKQLLYLERAGFKAKSCEPCRGSHFKVTFDGVKTTVVMSCHEGGPRNLANTLALLRRNSR
jgi:hypothetical protein